MIRHSGEGVVLEGGSLFFASPIPFCSSSQEAQFGVDNEEDGHRVTMTWVLEFDLS